MPKFHRTFILKLRKTEECAMKLCIIGTGYVGLTAGACLAEMGHQVICVDKDVEKLDKLAQGICPIYEPGLDSLIKSNVTASRLKFTPNLDEAVKESKVCFIAVGTPQNEDGSADLSTVFDVAEEIARAMNGYKVIVDKSTVPPGTAEKVSNIIQNNTGFEFDVVSNPEFLKQGSAVEDFLNPDRVIMGSDSDKASKIMKEIYLSFLETGKSLIVMDVKSAEMTKYAANAFLAVKISYINEIANICEYIGADVEKVRNGIATDARIGPIFLYPGLGYGGSCLPKDVNALISMTKDCAIENSLLVAADKINKAQRLSFVRKITKRFGEDLSGKTFGVLGLAFKPETNDMREAPAITVINELLQRGAKIKAYDPQAMESAKNIFQNKIEYAANTYEALNESDAMVLLTEWNEFKNIDFDSVKELLKTPIVFDGRNQYKLKNIAKEGFEYFCIGK